MNDTYIGAMLAQERLAMAAVQLAIAQRHLRTAEREMVGAMEAAKQFIASVSKERER